MISLLEPDIFFCQPYIFLRGPDLLLFFHGLHWFGSLWRLWMDVQWQREQNKRSKSGVPSHKIHCRYFPHNSVGHKRLFCLRKIKIERYLRSLATLNAVLYAHSSECLDGIYKCVTCPANPLRLPQT